MSFGIIVAFLIAIDEFLYRFRRVKLVWDCNLDSAARQWALFLVENAPLGEVQAVLCEESFCGLRGMGASLYDSRTLLWVALGRELTGVEIWTC